MSDVTTDPITHTLELVAEKHGDPTELVYKRLFSQNPELEALFIMDRDSSARGNMLSQVLECFLDFQDTSHFATSLISSERTNHQHIGVPTETFDTFFTTIAGTFKEILQNDWTPEIDEAWNEMLAKLTRAVHAEQ